MRIFSLCFAVMVFTADLAFSACKLTTLKDLRNHLEQAQVKRIVFFASWCSDCRHSLANATDTDVLVGVFDKPEHLTRVYKSLGKPLPACFVDQKDQIAKAYAVNGLPYEFILRR